MLSQDYLSCIKRIDFIVFLRKEPDAVEVLLKHKVNVNVVNNLKQTPLHIAVGVKSPECVKLLIKGKADPSLKVRRKTVVEEKL